MPIKAIVFDFGGVIAPGIFLEYVKTLQENDPKRKLFHNMSSKWDIGEYSIEQFHEAVSKLTDIPKHKVESDFYSKARSHPDVIDIVNKLKTKYVVALFTNNFDYNLIRYFDVLNLHGLFDEVIISSQHKMTKPDPKFYHKMLKIIDANNDEVIFIDDLQENVDAGNKLGITSFLFTNSKQLKSDLKSKGVNI